MFHKRGRQLYAVTLIVQQHDDESVAQNRTAGDITFLQSKSAERIAQHQQRALRESGPEEHLQHFKPPEPTAAVVLINLVAAFYLLQSGVAAHQLRRHAFPFGRLDRQGMHVNQRIHRRLFGADLKSVQ